MIVTNTVKSLLHLFLPHHCAGCGSDIVSHQQVLCLSCIDQLPVTHFGAYADNPVEKIFNGRLSINHAASYLYFTKDSLLQHLVHQLKYNNHQATGRYLGKRMGEAIITANRFQPIDALVPLPLFAARERKRGYNQAAVLCQGMAEVMRVPVLENVITRHQSTTTQTNKNRMQRWQNMAGKFELLQPALIQNKHILLVDDIVTTGATLEACGHELLTVANVKLSLFTLAYTSR